MTPMSFPEAVTRDLRRGAARILRMALLLSLYAMFPVPVKGVCENITCDQGYQCPSAPKRHHRSLTTLNKKRFVGPQVRDFVKQLHSLPYPDSSVVPPEEFNSVVESGKEAVPFLLSQLSSSDDLDADAAAVALEQITNKSFAQASEHRGPHSDPQKWQDVVLKYHTWWDEHKAKTQVKWLTDDLNDPRVSVRLSAIQRLGALGDPVAIPALRKVLGDRQMRLDAAVALAELGDQASIPVLINDFLTDDALSGRHTGICWLERLTGQTLGFDPESDKQSRDIAVEKWKQWWSRHGSKSLARKGTS